MFWRAKPTIDEDEEEWQLQTWEYLLTHLGGLHALGSFHSVRPSHDDFPRTGKSGHDHALAVLTQVATWMRVDLRGFRLVPQDRAVDPKLGAFAIVQNAPVDPAGTYSIDWEEGHTITYEPGRASDLQHLIAVFAHELCHAVLGGVPVPPPGDAELEEPATDLATVFHGFGLFGGNEAFRFVQHTDAATGAQGWSTSSLGYMTQNEWGYALALRALLTADDLDRILSDATPELQTQIRRNTKYLGRNPDILERLRSGG